MRKRTPTKRELLEILASKGWDEPQLIRLNMRLLKRINDELAPLLVPQFMPWDKITQNGQNDQNRGLGAYNLHFMHFPIKITV